MKPFDKITLVRYRDAQQCLIVGFESGRLAHFHAVPCTAADTLMDPQTRDQAFLRYIIGKFAWTEHGMPAYGTG